MDLFYHNTISQTAPDPRAPQNTRIKWGLPKIALIIDNIWDLDMKSRAKNNIVIELLAILMTRGLGIQQSWNSQKLWQNQFEAYEFLSIITNIMIVIIWWSPYDLKTCAKGCRWSNLPIGDNGHTTTTALMGRFRILNKIRFTTTTTIIIPNGMMIMCWEGQRGTLSLILQWRIWRSWSKN